MARARKPRNITPDLSAFIAEIGGVPREYGGYEVLTKLGTLWVKAMPGEKSGGGWIACRFEEVERARVHFKVRTLGHRLNPYSGKWNWYEGLGHEKAGVDYMIRLFEEEVRRIL
jgi:hypothetical protein